MNLIDNKKILLDTNVYINYFEKQADSIEVKKFKSLLRNDEYCLVTSIYNIAELANVDVLSEQTKSLVKWIDTIDKLWVHDKWVIQSWEVKKFIYKHYYNFENEYEVFTQHLSSCLHEQNDRYNPQTNYRMCFPGIKAWDLLRNYHQNKDILNQSKIGCTQGAETIRKAVKDRAYDFDNEEIFYKWIDWSLLPARTTDNKVISKNDREILLKWLCKQNRNEILKNCPAFAVENYFSKYKRSDVSRTPRDSDAIDLPILSAALAYCDYFIVEDRFVKSSANYIRKHAGYAINARVCNFEDFLNDHSE